MQQNLINLKLFLDAMGLPSKIDSVEDRKLLQKAVYLAQKSAFNLGYRYSWYKMGPYCSALTDAYYELDRSTDSAEVASYTLHPQIAPKLEQVKQMLKPPSGIEKHDWAELLCSYDYLRTVSGYTELDADAKLKELKQHLAPFLDKGKARLKECGYLN